MENRHVLLVIAWLLSSVAYAQETREVTERKGSYSEKYTVLKANKRTRHGPYQQFFGEKLIEKGEYSQDQRVGPWEFYDMMGKLDQTFDYTTRQVLFSTLYNQPDSLQKVYTIVTNADTTYAPLAKPPVPVGGKNQLVRIMMTNLRSPGTPLGLGKTSMVTVAYLVDETGKFGPVRIVQSSAEPAKTAEALRVINLYSTLQWLPGELNGRKVSTVSMQPVRFYHE